LAAAYPQRRRRRRSDLRVAVAFLLPGFLGLVAFLILPLCASLLLSFSNWQVIGQTRFVGLANYINLFTRDPIFWSVFRVTLLYTAEYLILNIVISLGMALWIGQSVLGQAAVPPAVLSADIHAPDRHRPGLAADADPRRYR
jgi:multiple sugar transport system permease protein